MFSMILNGLYLVQTSPAQAAYSVRPSYIAVLQVLQYTGSLLLAFLSKLFLCYRPPGICASFG